MAYLSINSLFHKIADYQGIEQGTDLWVSGGIFAFSGQTGGHPGYGWRLDHKLSLGITWVRAVLANAGHRSVFYVNAPIRQGGYYIGGRPMGWSFEVAGDVADGLYKGEHVYLVSSGYVGVSGPDSEHFPLGGLRAVAQSTGFTVNTPSGPHDAAIVAREMYRALFAANVGMFRKSGGDVAGFDSWRAVHYLCHNVEGAFELGVLDPADGATVYAFIEQKLLPVLEAPPGNNAGDKGGEGLPPGTSFFQWYNGPPWGIPALYSVYKLLPDGDLVKERLGKVIKRYCQYALDIEMTVPGQGTYVYVVGFTGDAATGINGKPVPSLLPYITPQTLLIEYGTDTRYWNIRLRALAAEVLQSSVLQAAVLNDLQVLKPSASVIEKSWIVDGDGEYV